MKKITSVRTSVKEDKILAVIRVEGQEQPIFLTSKQVEAATGLTRNFSVLKGSSISVTFYKKGDKLNSGTEVTEDDKIVKEYEIELTEKLANISAAASLGAAMF